MIILSKFLTCVVTHEVFCVKINNKFSFQIKFTRLYAHIIRRRQIVRANKSRKNSAFAGINNKKEKNNSTPQ